MSRVAEDETCYDSAGERGYDWIAIMAVDPGLHTGVATGLFPCGAEIIESKMVKDILPLNMGMEAYELNTGDASEDEQFWEVGMAMQIARKWKQFVSSANFRIDFAEDARIRDDSIKHLLVIEDWQVRLPMRTANRVVMSPARIASVVEGLLAEKVRLGNKSEEIRRAPIVYQSPADAKRYATDARLREWGLWVKGSDHARDANRHLCLALLNETK